VAGDDAVALDVAWRYRGAWRSAVIDRARIADARGLVGLAGQGFPITSASAGDVVRYLAAFESANRDYLPKILASRACGWCDDGRSFLWGTTAIGTDTRLQVDAGTASYARHFRAAGTLDGWRAAWDAAQPYPRVVLGVYASLAPMVLGMVPEASGFVVDWWGRTTGGKTTTLRLAASVWGCRRLVASWDTTGVGVERYAALAWCLPLILDDTKRAKDKEALAGMVYLVTGTQGRIRGSQDGGLRHTVDLRTVLLSTGEQAVTSYTEEAGARARTLSIEGLPFGVDSPAAREAGDLIDVATLDHHGHVGPAVVAYAIAHRESWPYWLARWRAVRDTYGAATGPAARAGQYLATLTIAAELAEAACGLTVHAGALAEAVRHAGASTASADVALAALRVTLDWTTAHAGCVHVPGSGPPPPRCIALLRRDDGVTILALNPREWAEAMERSGYSVPDVRAEWERRGWARLSQVRLGGRTEAHPRWLRLSPDCPLVAETYPDLPHPRRVEHREDADADGQIAEFRERYR
jgi:hypothetical protein